MFSKFLEEYGDRFKATAIEKYVRHPEGFAGRVDMAGILTSKRGKEIPVLVDIKTSNNIYKTHGIQMTAYNRALNFEYDELYVLWFPIRKNDLNNWEFQRLTGPAAVIISSL